MNPRSHEGLVGIGYFYKELGLYPDAIKILERIIEQVPLQLTTFDYKSNAEYREGDLEGLISTLLSRLEIDENEMGSMSSIASAYARMGENEKALETFEEIQRTDSTFLNRDLLAKKLFLILKEDFDKASKIEVNAWPIFPYLLNDQSGLEESSKLFLTSRIKSSEEGLISIYRMFKYPMFDSIRDKKWFRELEKSEKEKYDRIFREFPRAEKLLGMSGF